MDAIAPFHLENFFCAYQKIEIGKISQDLAELE